MQISFAPTVEKNRKLLPFLLLSLLLHIAVLTLPCQQEEYFGVITPDRMEIYLSASTAVEKIPISEDKTATVTHANPQRIPVTLKALVIPQIDPVMRLYPGNNARFLDLQHIMESAKNFAREDAKKSEQNIAAQKEKIHNTPASYLMRNGKQPYEEIHLANGTLKIITSAGAICFKPAPYFAHDLPGLFGIPTTCQ